MKKLIPPIELLQEQGTRILSERDDDTVRKRLGEFIHYYEPLNYCMTYDTPLWRIRKTSDPNGFATISEIHHPPAHFTRAGRMNEPGMPMLYVSFTPFTAMTEVKAKVGEHLHMISYSMRKDRPLRTLILGEFTNIHKGGHGSLSDEVNAKLNEILKKMSVEPGLSFIFMDAFLSSILADSKMADLNYLHSRILASLLFEKYPSIEAIHYPSIAREGAMNLAIKPKAADEALQIKWTSVIRIDNQFDYGLYRFTVVRNARGFCGDGKIDWKETTS